MKKIICAILIFCAVIFLGCRSNQIGTDIETELRPSLAETDCIPSEKEVQRKINIIPKISITHPASAPYTIKKINGESYDYESQMTLRLDGSLEIMLEKEAEIGFVLLFWEDEPCDDFSIEISQDGINWKEKARVQYGLKNSTPVGFESESVTYLRFVSFAEGDFAVSGIAVYSGRNSESGIVNRITTDYSPVHISIENEYGEITHDEDIIIKLRGNSTLNAEKKSYNIKFVEKQKILGIKGSRKWCLLANHFDKTLLLNKLTYDFTGKAGLVYIESVFAEVWLDGNYEGVYLLTEPVSDAKTSVNINPKKSEYLLERHGYYDYSSTAYNVSPIYGIVFKSITPDSLELTMENKKEIAGYFSKADKACKSQDEEQLRSIFDIDSFVNMYICEELFKDIDIFHGSTYYYIKNGKIFSGPMWDMDLCCGNVSMNEYSEEKYRLYWNVPDYNGKGYGDMSGDSTSGIWAQVDWYKELMKCSFFVDLVKARYSELIPEIESLYSENGVIDTFVSEYGEAFLKNYEDTGYSVEEKYVVYASDTRYSSYSQYIDALKTWLNKRDSYIRNYLEID